MHEQLVLFEGQLGPKYRVVRNQLNIVPVDIEDSPLATCPFKTALKGIYLLSSSSESLTKTTRRPQKRKKQKCWESLLARRQLFERGRWRRHHWGLGFCLGSTTRGWWTTTITPATLDPSTRTTPPSERVLSEHPRVVTSWNSRLRLMTKRGRSSMLASKPSGVDPLLLPPPSVIMLLINQLIFLLVSILCLAVRVCAFWVF